MEKRQNTAYLTLMNVVAALSVVILHTNDCYWDFSTERYWITANIINGVFVFAVPVFFMITGATMLDYPSRYDTPTFFKKRAEKTLLPFIVWSLICLLLNIAVFHTVKWSDLSLPYVINGILTTKFNTIYWFFPPLFCVYAVIPLFAAVPQDKKRSLFTYLAIAGFAANMLVPFLIRWLELPLTWPFEVRVASSYLLYVLVGYLISRYDMPRFVRYGVYLLALGGLLGYTYGTQQLSFEAGKIVDFYKGATNVTAVCYGVGVFLFLRQIGNRLMACRPIGKVVGVLKGYTFPLYLLHMPVIWELRRLLPINKYSILWRLGGVLLIVPLCMGVTWLIRKIPLVRKILP